MKKNYIRPAMKSKVIVTVHMVASSSDNLPNGDGYTSGSISGQANGRRGIWGDLWYDDASEEE
jgi:hypothetical protein